MECKLEPNDDKWFAGTILQRDTNWSRSPLETPPYLIRFDYGVSDTVNMLVLYELPFLMYYLCGSFYRNIRGNVISMDLKIVSGYPTREQRQIILL